MYKTVTADNTTIKREDITKGISYFEVIPTNLSISQNILNIWEYGRKKVVATCLSLADARLKVAQYRATGILI